MPENSSTTEEITAAGGQVVPAREAGGAPGDPSPIYPARPDEALTERRYRPRRIKVPLILFLLTCVSTFFVGATRWMPTFYLIEAVESGSMMPIRQVILRHWDDGLTYMVCVLAILMAHEMGHFVMTLVHRVRSSVPYFLPIPFTPLGTLGAVIVMDGQRADRKQMFDIGIAGPIAGLVIAVPIMWHGVATLDLSTNQAGGLLLDTPLAVKMMLSQANPEGYVAGNRIWIGQLNPFFMAGWVGFLVTGLNMLPVSQLDGGHVIYCLFGKWAHLIARGFMIFVIALVVYDVSSFGIWMLMVVLILMMGTDHPPTKDDNVKLGWLRTSIGYASLAIPILCFPPRAMIAVMSTG